MENATHFDKLEGNREDKVEQYNQQWDKAEKDTKEDKIICLSDLIGNAESLID